MGRLGTKPPALAIVTPAVARALDEVSKAALIDAYIQALALGLGECDRPPTLADVSHDLAPLLSIRGDRTPRILLEKNFRRTNNGTPSTARRTQAEGPHDPND